MSIMDGVVVLEGEKRNNNNNKNERNNNNQKNNKRGFINRSREFNDSYYSFSNSSYLPEEERGKETEVTEEKVEVRNDKRADEINSFCDNFTDNTDNYRALQDIVSNEFPDIIGYIRAYYSGKNTPLFIDSLNRLVKIMSTTQFANVLNGILTSGIWTEDGTYDKIWRHIGYALSVALETSHERMHTDVIRLYATNILPRMWKPEIQDITTQTGVTKDLALDLIIAIPMIDSEWNGANIDAFYHRFLDKMIIHAEDNMDVLNWEVQGMLYEKFFGKTKNALKVIGKYLVSERIETLESEVATAVYDEFKKMIFSKLDTYDINDIEYVFNFVSKYKQNNPDANMLFDSVKASEYENVRKGLLSVMDKTPDAMKYLA